MKFLQAVKVFQLNLLRQAGVAITPQQLGLKSDPIADLQAKSAAASNGFGGILASLTNSNAAMTGMPLPQPPTPPVDLDDKAALLKYQQDLLAYNQNSQLYNQRMMQMLLQQFQAVQQQALANRNAASPGSSTGGVSTDTAPLGVGGIL
jgi:hypothetical protein